MDLKGAKQNKRAQESSFLKRSLMTKSSKQGTSEIRQTESADYEHQIFLDGIEGTEIEK
jgi:hypothetical protein